MLWKFSQDKVNFLPWYSPLVFHAVTHLQCKYTHSVMYVRKKDRASRWFWPLQYDKLQYTTVMTPAKNNRTLACCPGAWTVYIQYMIESHVQISELVEGCLIFHSSNPRRGNIKRHWIKHPSYFYYSSIYNVTSYCFSTVCLWCQWNRDTHRGVQSATWSWSTPRNSFIAKEYLVTTLNFITSQEFMSLAEHLCCMSLPVGQAIEHVKTETLS